MGTPSAAAMLTSALQLVVSVTLSVNSLWITPVTWIIGRLWCVLFPYITPLIDLIATRARPLAMLLVVLPCSFIMRSHQACTEWVFQRFLADAKAHSKRVARVQAAVKQRLERPPSERRKMCTARAPWQNLSTRFADYKSNSDCIFVGDLRNVLGLDTEKALVSLEPLVDVGQITRYLLPLGFMLKTTLEIEEATIGGLAMAVGMTTASHKFGLLQETVTEYQVVLGDGELVSCTRHNQHKELWHALPWSHGSLGLLVGLTLEVMPVTPWVALSYKAVQGNARICSEIRRVSLEPDPADFVEATLFSAETAVVMTASFVQAPDSSIGQVNNCNYWFKPWFYCHIRDMFHAASKPCAQGTVVEYIPTSQYIFRHNRAVFWSLNDQLPEKYGNHWLFRLLFGWLTPPKVTFLKLPATPAIKHEMMLQRVYQDIVLPIGSLEKAIAQADQLFGIWPLLVYPSRIYDHGPDLQGQFRAPQVKVPGESYGMFYDLGIYGIPAMVSTGRADEYKAVSNMRAMEELTTELGGAPFLYADTFMTRKEFENMFDLSLYERVRTKYKAVEHFPHLYDKTSGCQSFDWKTILEQESAQSKKHK